MKGEKYINNNIFNAECGTKNQDTELLGRFNTGQFRGIQSSWKRPILRALLLQIEPDGAEGGN